MTPPGCGRIRPGTPDRRRGFSLLETQVAFLLLGLSLAGLVPLIALQLRMSRLVARANPHSDEVPVVTATPLLWPSATFYLTPPVVTLAGSPSSIDAQTTKWIRKLGASAALTAADTPFSDTDLQTAHDPLNQSGVSITEAPVRSTVDNTVTVHIIVTE
jgi:Tfp pilus assembly protein PilV